MLDPRSSDRAMEATETDLKQLSHVIKLALSRATAACVPDSAFDDIKRVAVTLQHDGEQTTITGVLIMPTPCL